MQMKASGAKRIRGQPLKPGRRKAHVEMDVFDSRMSHQYRERKENELYIFDEEGRLSVRDKGVKHFLFAKLSFFYSLQSYPWPVIIAFSALLYIAVLFVFTLGYLLWASACGASADGLRWTTALYFTIVSLAANGGYLGEPALTMTDPSSMCFTGRTFIVMILSYTNIIFVGFIAALVVGKAERAGNIGQCIVFSNYCTLTPVPSRRGRSWQLTFRMANSRSQTSIAHGRLRLFVVTTEPLRRHRRARSTREEGEREEGGRGEREEGGRGEGDSSGDSGSSGSESGAGARGVRFPQPVGPAAAGPAGPAGRVRTCLREVRWTCPEERHLDAGGGHLSLWFPVRVQHTIGPGSPLARWVEEQYGEDRATRRRRARPFQVVAAFDAVELNSGAIITAKETYSAKDIVAHYHFSNKVVHLHPSTHEVELDYHHFNEVLPDTDVESSSTDNNYTV